ncbi:hypothetical protein QUC32_12180 [Novosphingobium resinovorum]|uniref:hypothetical protein n=1 Tax=Novosphingobium TaxID=165696 RepID=UPI001B3C7F84|nr:MULTISPECIES: hypothetical protein [Novosphingobium]MBF7010432.1 hypothetical protein [Novosphingobium sp. HR1a]WJM28433.1 hypothetical protein QUC32_12180 [Novosphingobium resinovorum]
METRGQEVHLDKEEARGGETSGVVRYVLLISLALVIIALSAIWLTGALTTPETGGHADTEKAVAQQQDQPQ